MTSLRLIWRYFAQQKWRLVASSLLATLTVISTVSLLGVSGWLISRAAQMPPILDLNIAIVAVRTFALLRSVTRYSERLISHDATFRSLTTLRMALYEKLEAITPLRLSSYRRGDLISRVVTDVDEIQNLPLRVVIPLVSSVLASVFSIALMTWLLPSAGFALAVTLLISSTAVPWLTTRQLTHRERQVAGQRGQLSENLLEHFAGLTDLIMLNATQHSLEQINRTNTDLMEIEKANAKGMGAANALLVILQGAALVCSVLAATSAVSQGTLSPVTMVVIALLPLAAFESVMSLPAAITSLSRVQGSADRLSEILTQTVPARNESEVSLSATSIDVQHVSLRWPEAQEDAVYDISFEAPPKSRIGIVGASGSGKSTIVNMLIKFLSPRTGTYSLDGIDSQEIPGTQIRSHVVATGHDAHIFATSIRENLQLATSQLIDDAKAWEVLQQVQLESWVRSLPTGLDTIVGENGKTISGGQRQRLLMARMLIRNPDVWVLDEPTEHLDTSLAHQVMDAINTKAKDSTLIVVSHRATDVGESDTVISLDR